MPFFEDAILNFTVKAKGSEKIGLTTKGLENVRIASGRTKMGFFTLKNELDRLGYRFNKNGKLVNAFNGGIIGPRGTEKALGRVTLSSKRFKAEMLSVMFFGMAMQRLFGGINKSVDDLVGTTEIMGSTFNILTLGPALDIQNAMLGLSDALLGLPQPMQDAIGWGARLGEWAGQALATVGQLSLGWSGLGQFFGAFSSKTKILDELSDPTTDAVGRWGKLKDAFSGAKTAIIDGLSGIKTKMQDILPDSVNNTFSSIKAKALSSIDAINAKLEASAALRYTVYFAAVLAGLNIGKQIGDAITNAVPGIGQAFQNLFSRLEQIPGIGYFVKNMRAFLDLAGIATTFVAGAPAGMTTGQATGALWSDFLSTQGVKKFASGGLVTSPTLGMIGEAGPEAVVPLSRMPDMFSSNITINATIASDMDVTRLGRRIADAQAQELRALLVR